MKKIFIVFMVLIGFVLPFGSGTFAESYNYKTGYIDSHPEVKDKDMYPQVYDNNTTTLSGVMAPDTNVYVFNSTVPINISAFYFSSNSSYDLSSVITLKFYDINGNLLKIFDLVSNGYTSISLNGVAKISYFTTRVGTKIGEFDVFESAPIVHDELSNLNLSKSTTSVFLNWLIPSGNIDFKSTKIYRDGVLLGTKDNKSTYFQDINIEPSKTYNYKVTAVYSDDFETMGITNSIVTDDKSVDDSLIPPSPVSGLKVKDITVDGATLTWTNPDDADFSKLKLYENNVYKEDLLISTSKVLSGLSANKNYSYALTAVDIDGNESSPISISFTTLEGKDEIPPNVVKGINITEGSGNLSVSWNKSLESDLSGYNVYVNGVKHNTTIIKNTFYSIPELENGTGYSITVTAVDISGNESVPSVVAFGTPTINGMPILGMDYELKDVATAVSNWFAEYWLIIAFATAIPLSFLIGIRIKHLFVG